MNRYETNKEIERLIRKKDTAGAGFSEADKALIRQYSGSGGHIGKGAKSTARGGNNPLYEFYTPGYICELMHELALFHGYNGGTVLEPACATGNLIAPFKDRSQITAFEITEITARVTQILYPEVRLHRRYFETAFLTPDRFTSKLSGKVTWLQGYPFSLVIGNPPYGRFKSRYSSYFSKPKIPQVEQFFMYYGMQLLKPGGLLVFITSQNFLRNGTGYQHFKRELGKLAILKDAYRLPPVFEESNVPTDIIILEKR